MALIQLAELSDALELGHHELVSLVGGGGKTTCLFTLGEQLPGTGVLTTTTKMGRDRTNGHPALFAPSDDELLAALAETSPVIAWDADCGHKAIGVAPETCDKWFGFVDNVIVEADGSRRKPFKAPRPYEPVVPSATTALVACIGADAIGRVIADACQRPLRVAALAGCGPYERLTPERAVSVLLDDFGSRKDCPPAARFAVVVNNVGSAAEPLAAELIELLADRSPATTAVAISQADPPGS